MHRARRTTAREFRVERARNSIWAWLKMRTNTHRERERNVVRMREREETSEKKNPLWEQENVEEKFFVSQQIDMIYFVDDKTMRKRMVRFFLLSLNQSKKEWREHKEIYWKVDWISISIWAFGLDSKGHHQCSNMHELTVSKKESLFDQIRLSDMSWKNIDLASKGVHAKSIFQLT